MTMILVVVVVVLAAILGVIIYFILQRNKKDEARRRREERENWRFNFFSQISRVFTENDVPFMFHRIFSRQMIMTDYQGHTHSSASPAYIEIRPFATTREKPLYSCYEEKLVLCKLSDDEKMQEALEKFSELIVTSIRRVNKIFYRESLSNLLENPHLDCTGIDGEYHGRKLLHYLQIHNQYWQASEEIRGRFVHEYLELGQIQLSVWQDIGGLLKVEKEGTANSAA